MAAVVLIGAITVLAPQSTLGTQLIKALDFIKPMMAQLQANANQVAIIRQAIELLAKHAELIGSTIASFAALGFLHQAYDYCTKKSRFSGGANRLGGNHFNNNSQYWNSNQNRYRYNYN